MAEDLPYIQDFCPNCMNYGWKQPSGEGKLLRCSKCKFISYCSKECQEEHWKKVHKHHCKYLAKEKERKKSRHDPASCPGCMKQAEIGLTEMSKADNPYLGCPWTINHLPPLPRPRNAGGQDEPVPLPFKLGEMCGEWQTKAENMVSIMTELLHKMKVTKHMLHKMKVTKHMVKPGAINLMDELVNKMRQDIWLAYIYVVPSRLDRCIAESMKATVLKIIKLAAAIDKELYAYKHQDKTVFRLWDTFRLILNILYQYIWDVVRQDAARLGFPGISEDAKQLIVTSDQVNDKCRKVLGSMDGILVPYEDLLKILCDGDLHQLCSWYSQDMVVSDVWSFYNFYCEVPSIYQSDLTQSYLCGEEECYKKVDIRDDQISVSCLKTSYAARGSLCDYCFLVSSGKVHRCTRCLTKYYCGVECRDQDWEVHRLGCEGGQERKVKGGQEDRKEEGDKNLEEIVSVLEEMNLNTD